ncbi:DNA glycosylase/AP lyase [Chytriomyces sp. MP71]|nr:DNA glycosylase/AP lyase [Chytriomyces sp. MP71]
MPELPEVERARRQLHDIAHGKTITRVEAFEDTIVFCDGCTSERFSATLTGAKVVGTGRRGKNFWLELGECDEYPVMHFGMTGSIMVKGSPVFKYVDFKTSDEEFPPRFCKFVITLDDGTQFAFADPRRLARIRLIKAPIETQKPISELGFDPLLDMPDVTEFTRLLMKPKKPIKSLLLDQSFSAGIGNWVADEVLYRARVHPSQYTNTLLPGEIKALHEAIVDIIATACASDVNADSDKFPKSWLFHYRWFKGKRSATKPAMPDGNEIEFLTLGGRTSAIIPAVQKLRDGDGDDNEKEALDTTNRDVKVRSPSTKKTKKRTASRKKSRKESDDEESEDYVDSEVQELPVKRVKKEATSRKSKEVKKGKKDVRNLSVFAFTPDIRVE